MHECPLFIGFRLIYLGYIGMHDSLCSALPMVGCWIVTFVVVMWVTDPFHVPDGKVIYVPVVSINCA